MRNFVFQSPTKLYFGKDQENEVGNIIKAMGIKRILLHYGQNSIKKSGLYDRILAALSNANLEVYELAGVEPNPKVTLVRTGVEIVKSKQIELVLAVGGGSVIDSAKAIAVASCSEADPWCFSMHEIPVTKCLPIGVILTISAAGSELSNSCVITNPDGLLKRGFNSDLFRPTFAILNPELTYSVSRYQTGCGIVDILMHTLERYFVKEEANELISMMSEGLLKAVIAAGKTAIAEPNNYEARSILMLASSLSHNGLTNMGQKFYFTVHKMEHELSGRYDFIAHGAGLAVLFPAWARYVYHDDIDRFARFAYEVMDVDRKLEPQLAAETGINKLETYFKELGMPIRLHEFGIDEQYFDDMATKALNTKEHTLLGFRSLTKDDIVNIFKNAY